MINSRPLTYVYGDFESGFILTPSHFLVSTRKLGLYSSSDGDYNDVDFHIHEDSTIKLRKKVQKHLDFFWKVWKDEYLLSLRERIPLVHKQFKSYCDKEPTEGTIVVVNDDNLPRCSWKFGKIVRLIISRDCKIQSAEVQLPGQSIITRSISHLYPLKLPEKADKSVKGLDETDVREKSVFKQNTTEPVEERRSKQPRK